MDGCLIGRWAVSDIKSVSTSISDDGSQGEESGVWDLSKRLGNRRTSGGHSWVDLFGSHQRLLVRVGTIQYTKYMMRATKAITLLLACIPGRRPH